MRLRLLLILSLFSASVTAAPVTWTLHHDSGQVAHGGTFIFDADAPLTSSVLSLGADTVRWSNGWYSDVQVFSGLFNPLRDEYLNYYDCRYEFVDHVDEDGNASIYREGCAGRSSPAELSLQTDDLTYRVMFDTPLTNNGGSVNYTFDTYSRILCRGYCGSSTGIAIASVVPVPAAMWLFGTALVGLAGLRRRQRAG